MALDLFPQACVVNGDRSLPGKRVQEVEPFLIAMDRRAVENFHHANDLTLHDQGHPVVRVKVLFLEKILMKPVLQFMWQAGYLYHVPLHDSPSGVTFSQAHPARLNDIAAEAMPGSIFQCVHDRVEEQNRGSIHFQQRDGTGGQDAQAEPKIK